MRKIAFVSLAFLLVAALVMPATAEARRRSSFGSRSFSSKSWGVKKPVKPVAMAPKAPVKVQKPSVPASAPQSTAGVNGVSSAKASTPASSSPSSTPASAASPLAQPAGGGMFSNIASSFMGTGLAMWMFGNDDKPAPVVEAANPVVEEAVGEVAQPSAVN